MQDDVSRLVATEDRETEPPDGGSVACACALRSLWPSREKTQARLGARPPSGVAAGLPVNNRSITAQPA